MSDSLKKRWWEPGPYVERVFRGSTAGERWAWAERRADKRPRVGGWPRPMTVDDALQLVANFVYDDRPMNLTQVVNWGEATDILFGECQ